MQIKFCFCHSFKEYVFLLIRPAHYWLSILQHRQAKWPAILTSECSTAERVYICTYFAPAICAHEFQNGGFFGFMTGHYSGHFFLVIRNNASEQLCHMVLRYKYLEYVLSTHNFQPISPFENH